ncbi:MAG: CHAD domain-containing protein [Methyloceanibacter sp.]|nr:CHAD domain-containing protein [Methyloceanibacter sp.]
MTLVARKPEHEAKEIELKLAFDPADAPRILDHPLLADANAVPKRRELFTVYYDTGDDVLRQAGVFLRVRATDDGYVQTIKTGNKAEFFERNEWEHPLPSYEPDLAHAEGTALAPLLIPEVREGLNPRFQTRFWRKAYQFQRDATEVELAIDQGEVTAGVLAAPICELELELKSGDARALFHLARELAETLPLTLAVKSKAERGFELLDGGDHRMEKAGGVEVAPDKTNAEAFRTIARNCLRQIVANTPAVRDGSPEALHQMRIGLRRLRAGIALFTKMLDGEDRESIKDALRWITQELGPARDLDVFMADVLEPLRAAHPDNAEVAEAHRDFMTRREAAYTRAKDAVGSDRFRGALLDLTAWIETGAWADYDNARSGPAPSDPIAAHGAKQLSRLRRRVKKSGANLRDLTVDERHELRIRAKRLRYATEFFATTFPGKKSDKRRSESLSALRDLQDSLGVFHDIATRQALRTAAKGDAFAHLPGPDMAEEKKQLKEARRAYARFIEVKAFWKA